MWFLSIQPIFILPPLYFSIRIYQKETKWTFFPKLFLFDYKFQYLFLLKANVILWPSAMAAFTSWVDKHILKDTWYLSSHNVLQKQNILWPALMTSLEEYGISQSQLTAAEQNCPWMFFQLCKSLMTILAMNPSKSHYVFAPAARV